MWSRWISIWFPHLFYAKKDWKLETCQTKEFVEPTADDHTIQDTESGLFIPLSLDGTFSTFNTRKHTDDDILNGIVVVITPEGSSWNPYCDSYDENKDSMTNAVGDLLPSKYIHRELIMDEDIRALMQYLAWRVSIDTMMLQSFQLWKLWRKSPHHSIVLMLQ